MHNTVPTPCSLGMRNPVSFAHQNPIMCLTLSRVRQNHACTNHRRTPNATFERGVCVRHANLQVLSQVVWVRGSWAVGPTTLTNTSFTCNSASSSTPGAAIYAAVGSGAAAQQPGEFARAISMIQTAGLSATVDVQGVATAEGPWGSNRTWPSTGFNISKGSLVVSGTCSSCGTSSGDASVLDTDAVPVLFNLADAASLSVTGLTLTNMCYRVRSGTTGTGPLVSFGMYSVVHRWWVTRGSCTACLSVGLLHSRACTCTSMTAFALDACLIVVDASMPCFRCWCHSISSTWRACAACCD